MILSIDVVLDVEYSRLGLGCSVRQVCACARFRIHNLLHRVERPPFYVVKLLNYILPMQNN